MQKLAELCVRRPIFAAVLILILVVIGTVGFERLGVDRFPNVDIPTVTVSTTLTGASPETMETQVTDKIEQQVNTISGIDQLRSVSSEGRSQVTVAFVLEKDADVATQEVRDKVNRAMRSLPEEVDPPIVQKQDPDAAPILGVALSSDRPVKEVTTYADQILSRQIESVNGVGGVDIAGGRLRQINVLPDAYQLRAYNLTVNDVTNALQQQNFDIPGGSVEEPKQTLTLRTLGRITKVSDFGKLIVKGGPEGQIRLSDVAQIEDGEETATTGAELNGRPTVLLLVRKQSGVNTLATIDGVKERLARAEKSLPKGYEMRVVRDQSDYIEAAVHSVEEHLILGSILASLVVLVFLLNWRSTFISAIAIPTSIIATFALMYFKGFTLNIITLLALTLAVGIVIDDAIVVLENIVRFIEEKNLSPADAAIEGTREIGLAVLATTISLVAVFLPVAFMSGITGRLMNSFGITMAFAIMVSLLVSFSLTPSLASKWLRRHKVKPGHARDERPEDRRGFYSHIDNLYTWMLKWSLAHRPVIVIICAVVLASMVPLARMIPQNFLPDDDESQFQVSMRAPEGTSLEETMVIARRVSSSIRKFPGVDYTLASVSSYGGNAAVNNASIFVKLVPVHERQDSQLEMISKMRRQLRKQFAADNLRLSARALSALGSIGGGGAAVQYSLSGPELSVLTSTAAKIVEEFKELPGVADADSSIIEGKPELVGDVDRQLAGDQNVPPVNVANALNYLVGGLKVTDYEEKGETYEVHVRGKQDFRVDPQGISLWTVAAADGTPVDLGSVVKFHKSTGPASINRLNRQRQVTITASTLPGVSSQELIDKLAEMIDKQNLGPAYTAQPTGQSSEQARAFAAFLSAFALSLIFMYLVLAAQFESWVHPITILSSLPLTIPFALLSLVLFGQSLNIFTALGILVLFGVVKKNAILQVDHTNQLREAGMPRYDAIILANRDRLRPILMTTLAFVAGMIPLVLSSGTGSGTNRAVGSVIMGGQSLSLLLTLLATPVVYSLFDDLALWWTAQRENLRGRFGIKDEDAVPDTE